MNVIEINGSERIFVYEDGERVSFDNAVRNDQKKNNSERMVTPQRVEPMTGIQPPELRRHPDLLPSIAVPADVRRGRPRK